MKPDTSSGECVDEPRAAEIRAALQRDLPSWRLLDSPRPYGWAPSRHFKATLAANERTIDAVIRQSWTHQGHDLELFLYTEILQHLMIPTATLIGEFGLDDGEPRWLVLADLGGEQARRDLPAHRAAYLCALGRLHGEARTLVQRGGLSRLPRFSAGSNEMDSWRCLLTKAIAEGGFGITRRAVSVFDALRPEMTADAGTAATLVHGDTDFSNAVIRGCELALVDWERACIGPPSLDLGPIVETLETYAELDAYRQGFRDVGHACPTTREVERWAREGETYDCIRWVCYYVDAALKGTPPPSDWRKRFYDPCLTRLERARPEAR